MTPDISIDVSWLTAHLLDDAEASLFVAPGSPISRAQFLSDVVATRQKVREHGGNRWAIFFESDYYEFSVGLIALISSGATVFLPSGIQGGMEDAVAAEVDGLLGDFQRRAQTVETGAALLSTDSIATAFEDDDSEGSRLIVYTSGSTGDPKKIDKSLRQIEAEINVLERTWGRLANNKVTVSSVSQQHIYGVLFTIFWPLFAGRRIFRTTLPSANSVLRTVEGDSGEEFLWVSSPPHLRRMNTDVDWTPLAEKVTEIFSSGAALPESAVADVTQCWGRSALEIYGSSETGGIATRRQSPGDPSKWKPFEAVTCRASGEGRLEIKSPYLETNDWYLTDDLVEFDGDGQFVLAGRSDHLVKIEGKRISFDKIHKTLTAMPEVAEARVILLEGRRDLIGALLVLTPEGIEALASSGRHSVIETIRKRLLDELEQLAVPRRFRFAAAIPTNAQGKQNLNEIRSLFRDAANPKRPEIVAQNTESGAEVWTLGIPENLVWFEGHFEQGAVLPGVVQIKWAVELGAASFDPKGGALRLESIKFHHLARPGDVLRLRLEYNAPKMHFTYTSGEDVVSSGRIVFES